jgi:hypothetical protein
MVDPTGRYGEAGHFYTVYAVALAAGMGPDMARRIAIFAQAPDQIDELNARPAGGQMFISEYAASRSGAHGENARQTREEKWLKAAYVMEGLHGLTGGPTEPERARRAELVLAETPGTPRHGAAVHAFGDSFAHTFVMDWSRPDVAERPPVPFREQHQYEVYGLERMGHANAGTKPDQIELRPKLYDRYATNLFRLFSQQSPVAVHMNEGQLNDLLKQVESARTEADQIKVLRDFIARAGGKLDYAPEKIGSQPYATALEAMEPGGVKTDAGVMTERGVKTELGEVKPDMLIEAGGSWMSPIQIKNRTVEQVVGPQTKASQYGVQWQWR